MSDFGFITMAFGSDRYIRQAENLALSLRHNMPGYKIAIVTDRPDVTPIFDIVIPMRKFDQAGTLYKLDIYEYSPFHETLFIDSDCIATKLFHAQIEQIKQYDFSPVVSRYLHRGETDSFLDDLDWTLDAVGGRAFPKFNGGVYFFRKSAFAQGIFDRAKHFYTEAKALGIRNFDKAGPGDETVIGLAMAEQSGSKYYDDLGHLMRTPMELVGRLEIDALGGGCRFKKGNVIVTPAICHFCGDWIGVPQYKIAEYYLRKGKRPSLPHRYAWIINRLINRLIYNLKSKHFPRFKRKIKTIIRRA
jgi:hypothetical protein